MGKNKLKSKNKSKNLNIEIDYDKLAEAIVRALEKTKENKLKNETCLPEEENEQNKTKKEYIFSIIKEIFSNIKLALLIIFKPYTFYRDDRVTGNMIIFSVFVTFVYGASSLISYLYGILYIVSAFLKKEYLLILFGIFLLFLGGVFIIASKEAEKIKDINLLVALFTSIIAVFTLFAAISALA